MNACPLGTPAQDPAVPRSGFSLVEVVLALGILSFSLVGIVYLLGSGLSSSRDSAKDSSLAAALRSVDATMRTYPATSTSGTTGSLSAIATSGTSFYFDLFGNMQSGTSSSTYFTAQVKRSDPVVTGSLMGMTNPSYSTPSYVDSGTSTPQRYFLWKVTFLYPFPANTQSSRLVIGEATYDPTLPHD